MKKLIVQSLIAFLLLSPRAYSQSFEPTKRYNANEVSTVANDENEIQVVVNNEAPIPLVTSESSKSSYGTKAAVSTFPYSESFESNLGIWVQATNDDGDWTRDAYGTPSPATGPNQGSNGSTYYIFTEAGTGATKTMSLEGSFDFSGLSYPAFFFDYHMYGSTMGTLSVDIYNGTSWTNNVWTKSGQQQRSESDPYDSVYVDLTSYAGLSNVKIRLRGVIGGFYSDMAVDNIRVIEGTLSTYVSSTVVQNTNDAYIGVANQDIICLKIETSGYASTASNLSQIIANTTGSTSAANMAKAELFYTYTDSLFSTTTPFGSAISNPNGTLTFNGSINLKTGTNYFWLAYDVLNSATPNNLLDAQCTTIKINGTNHTPTVSNPTGARKLVTTGLISVSTDTIKLQTSSCGESVSGNFNITNQGTANLTWNITEFIQKKPVKVAVYSYSTQTRLLNALNENPNIDATFVSAYNSKTLSDYDVLINCRGSNLKQDEVIAFIANGGVWIAEYGSNRYPINDWKLIEGSSVANMAYLPTGITSLKDPNHFLSTRVNWKDIPMNDNNVLAMMDLTGITDPAANIIATSYQSDRPNNPLIVEKNYGKGRIILFNFSYSENPTVSSEFTNLIQQVVISGGARYDVPFMAINSANGVNTPGIQTQRTLTFNTQGIGAGTYYPSCLIKSDDPSNPIDTLVCQLTVVGNPVIATDLTELAYGNVFEYGTLNDTITIYNQGCDTLKITNITSTASQFKPKWVQANILPFQSEELIVSFTPKAVTAYSGTLSIQNNDAVVVINLSGAGIDAPQIQVDLDVISDSVSVCNDTVHNQINIKNDGAATLDYNFECSKTGTIEILAMSYGVDMNKYFYPTLEVLANSNLNYHVSETKTHLASELESALVGKHVILFPRNDNGHDSVFTVFSPVLERFVKQGGAVIFCGTPNQEQLINSGLFDAEYKASFSNTTMQVDNSQHVITQSYPSQFPGSYYSYSYTFANSDVQTLISKNGNSVLSCRELGLGRVVYMGFDYYKNNSYTARLLINAVQWGSKFTPSWISLSASSGSLAVGESTPIDITFDANGYVAGKYRFNLKINSNDPVNKGFYVNCFFNVSGMPEITSASVLDFGDVLVGDTIVDSLKLYNVGCDTLKVTDINSSQIEFMAIDTIYNIPPKDSVMVAIKFSPSQIKYYTEYITFISNDANYQVKLAGTGIPAPTMVLSSFEITSTVSDCHASDYATITLNNEGDGELNYQFPSADEQIAAISPSSNYISNGAMFDVNFNQDIVLSGFDMQAWYSNSDIDLLIFYKQGSRTGFEQDSAAWTYHGKYTLHSNSDADLFEYLAIEELTLPQGDYAFYITTIKSSDYFKVTPSSDSYNDQVVTISNGSSVSYLFANYNSGFIMNGTLHYKLKPNWIDFTPSSGTVAANSSQELGVSFNAAGLLAGEYTANIILKSNDPLNNKDTIACKIIVSGGEPALEVANKVFNLGDELANNTLSQKLEVFNTGCDTLKISNVTSNSALFAVTSVTSFNVAPQKSAFIDIDFSPTTQGDFTGNLTINSNDADSVITLTGRCVTAKISDISFTTSASSYRVGNTIYIDVTYSSAVDVDVTNGTPKIKLNTDPVAYAYYYNGSGSTNLSFKYVVGTENSPLLDYTSINDLTLEGGTIEYNSAAAGISLPPLGTLSSKTIIIDNIHPLVEIEIPEAFTKDSVQVVTFTFNEKIYSFYTSDIVVDNATLSNFNTISNYFKYSVEVTAIKDSVVTLKIPLNAFYDAASNYNDSVFEAHYTYDPKKPIISLSAQDGDFTNKSPIALNILFNELASEFRVSELLVDGGSVSNFTEIIKDKQYKATITPKREGAINVKMEAGTITDLAGNDNANTNYTCVYDITAPKATLIYNGANLTNVSPVNITLELSEEVNDFLPEYLKLTNGSVSKITQTEDAKIYTIEIVPDSNGMVSANIVSNAFTDKAMNGNIASNTINLTYDGTAPLATISSNVNGSTNLSSFKVNISFNEKVNDFTLSDILVSNASADSLIEITAQLAYSLSITPDKCGEISVSISDSSVYDNAMNPVVITKAYSVIYDICPPELSEIKIDKLTGNSAIIGLKSNEKATLYYLLELSSQAQPTLSNIMDANSMPLLADLNQVNLNELAEKSAYTLYMVAKDSLAYTSDIQSISFTTNALGINDGTSSVASIYPNPNNGVFYLEINKALLSNNTVKIIDFTGKIISIIEITQSKQQLNLGYLSKGVYFVQYQSLKTIQTQKVVVE